MKILDCETQETTYSSLEHILECDRMSLNRFFENYDVNNDENIGVMSCNQRILTALKKEFNISNVSGDGLYWFHLTRTKPDEQFTDGILPLPEAVERLWPFLYSLLDNFSIKKWNEFKNHAETKNIGQSGSSYKEKLSNKTHWGPNAVMVRDIAFEHKKHLIHNFLDLPEKLLIHNYLDAPEIIEDICDAFEKEYKINLLEKFRENTKPCIVKFFHKEFKEKYLGNAIYYIYTQYKKMSLSCDCNNFFDGKGVLIKRKAIINIEFFRGVIMDKSEWKNHVCVKCIEEIGFEVSNVEDEKVNRDKIVFINKDGKQIKFITISLPVWDDAPNDSNVLKDFQNRVKIISKQF